MESTTKYAVLIGLAIFVTPAFAQGKPVCVDVSSDGRYNARPISFHEVLARNAFGEDRKVARLSTTCIHVDDSAFVSLHSFTRCIAVGYDVVTTTLGGRRKICRVIRVTAVPVNYADAKYRWN